MATIATTRSSGRTRNGFVLVMLTLTVAILLFSQCVLSSTDPKKQEEEEEEDLSFLEEPVDLALSEDNQSDSDDEPYDFEGYEEESTTSSEPVIDEKDVVVLTDANFTDFITKSKHVMVEFYAPWCGHCKVLAPEYAAAATQLKEDGLEGDVFLAKIDATEESLLSHKYGVEGFPTIIFFIEGVHKSYPGQRTKEGIVTWIKKKIGPGIHNITTTEEAENILKSGDTLVIGFLDSLSGEESQTLTTASKLEDDVSFYQTVNSDVAKFFHLDLKSKRPSLVMVKKEAEKISHFDGPFTKSAIIDFVFSNKLPLVTHFTMETAQSVFENPIKKQLLLFVSSNGSEKILPLFEGAAKSFKGKLIFVYVDLDNEDAGVPVANYFGITGEGPKILAYTGNEDGKKFILENDLTVETIKVFGEDFLQDKLKPFYKSDPIPEKNNGDVKVVVGDNFDEVVLDESKDVLLEIYAPWCGHCQALEPIYNKLAKHLIGIDSLIIAKMDGTTNDHPRAQADGFPTLLFFPAGNKSFEPITLDTDRTVVALYKFIKKHATIPFKLQKPDSVVKPESTDVHTTLESKSSTDDLKDEL